ncbi:MAG: hypothetical protein GY838_10300 [bacterium]|nr:hypothetical protein [bacterium]
MHLRERHLLHQRLTAVLRTSWVVLSVVVALASVSAAADTTHILRDLDLGAGLAAEVADDGSLVLRESTTGIPLLTAGFQVTGGRRVGLAAGPVFTSRTAEGAEGGRRGFAVQADDDDDGNVDEDRLDGRDNDGDGLVDEDHAAIGDAMVVISRPGDIHAEYYHWHQRHLRAIVFASLTTASAGRSVWRLETAGSDWLEVSATTTHHGLTGRAIAVPVHAFVTRVDAGPGSHSRWIGVSVLEEPGSDDVGRMVLDGEALHVRLGGRPALLAVTVSDSWLGLVRRLADARVVREGVTDPVDGRRAAWIVVPGCASCRQAGTPSFRWRLDDLGYLVLLADVTPTACAQLDPDLFRLAGRDLGAPDQVFWTPTAGGEQGIAWSTVTPERIARTGKGPSCPYVALEGLAAHDAAGVLGFRFRTPHPALVRRLTAREPLHEVTVGYLDGRSATAALEFDLASADPVRSAMAWAARESQAAGPTVVDQQRLLMSNRSQPNLSPELLQGWPNPFRESINLRLRIPATVGEAFAWDDPDDRPGNLDLQAAIPWQSGAPSVSVKVYGINGEELATLHEGSMRSGEMIVRWNGTDAFGRKVASGTYFCKLQLDDWSVTRRIVFVR